MPDLGQPAGLGEGTEHQKGARAARMTQRRSATPATAACSLTRMRTSTAPGCHRGGSAKRWPPAACTRASPISTDDHQRRRRLTTWAPGSR